MTKQLASKCADCTNFIVETEECARQHNLRFYSKDGYKRVCDDFEKATPAKAEWIFTTWFRSFWGKK